MLRAPALTLMRDEATKEYRLHSNRGGAGDFFQQRPSLAHATCTHLRRHSRRKLFYRRSKSILAVTLVRKQAGVSLGPQMITDANGSRALTFALWHRNTQPYNRIW
jgi:hypothetical protein